VSLTLRQREQLRRQRRRRYQQNLAGIRDEYIDVGAGLVSLFFFLTGARRLGGAVGLTESLWLLSRGKKISGISGLIVGASFLLFPSWPERILKPASSSST